MSQLQKVLEAIPLRQRWIIGIVAVAIAAGLFGFAKWQSERNFRPLYTSLSAEDAGTVVQKLRTSNVEFRLADNGTTVLVPSEKVAELRLDFASAGLPKSGRIGFELFDKTNFGMTEFTEHVNYRRALEGELERSIISLAEVEQARVHLTFPKESVFTESRQPAKASVLVKLKSGAKIPQAGVVGITNLIASAVEGLAPEAVSVLDMRGALLSRARLRLPGDDGSSNSEEAIEYRQKIERDLVAKINATLEPLLGAGKFRAAASVECDLTSGEESQESYDPDKSAVATSQTTEDKQSGPVTVGGQPGTASNLPRPPVSGPANSDGSTHTTKQLTYHTTRTVRRTKLPQGGVTKLSVAVLLDEGVRFEGTGPSARKVLIPVPPERIEKIQKLISAAVGISTERGDQLIVESMPFDSTLTLENLEAPAPVRAPAVSKPFAITDLVKDPKARMIAIGSAAAVVLLTGLMIVRRKKKKPSIKLESSPIGNELPPASTVESSQPPAPVKELPVAIPAFEPGGQHPGIAASRSEVLAGKIRESAEDEAELYASVIRGWLVEEARR